MKVVRGQHHDFLGVQFTFGNGVVKVSMMEYIRTLLEGFPDDNKRKTTTTPASTVLFQIREGSELLSPPKAKSFHTNVAKLLYLAKRARPDICIAVAFLTTRVTHPDSDDWNKLLRCMKYLYTTNNLVLTLSITELPVQKWWVDAAYAC